MSVSTRLIAWFGTLLGLGASTSANVLHALETGKGGTAAVVGAAFWPLALLASTETLTRKRWPSRVRPYAVAAVALVALVTAIVSYGHLHALLLSWGAGELEARIGPLAVDGLMMVCSLALTVSDVQDETRRDETERIETERVETTRDETPISPSRLVAAADETPVSARTSAPVSSRAPSRPVRARRDGRRDETARETARETDAQLLARLVSTHPECTSARAAASALGVGWQRASRVLAMRDETAARS